MIIDRAAKVVPTRYRSARLRQYMGQCIAAADSDDLLAAWLWTNEAWMLREFHHSLSEHHDVAKRAAGETRRRQRTAWTDALAPVPKAVRDAVDEAFAVLATIVEKEASEADEGLNICRQAWKSMSEELGLNPVDFFQRDRSEARTSPVESVGEVWERVSRSPERMAQAIADHRDAVHELALQEHQRREHLINGPLSVEGEFLHSTYCGLAIHRAAVEAEIKQTSGGEYNGPESWAIPMRMAANSRANTRRNQALTAALDSAVAALDTCSKIWEKVGEDFGLVPRAGTEPQRHPEGAAAVVAIAALARDLESARVGLQQILADHREAVHGDALVLNRRITHLMRTPSITLDQIDELHHREFEKLVADLARRDGMTVVQAHGGAGDLGADVSATTDDNLLVVFQAKHTASSRTVGTPDLQRFNGTARPHHKADIPVLVTNGTFTSPARQFAKEHGIQLVDRWALRQWATLGDPLCEIVALS
ncbi:restriction endonuclease [Kitasatospora sp. NPDC085895]|uniref:restriction endonuclease n=1 Tax=Kitasatospora sp. NPDC085895 TaxID=3155057 RepID=UPI00345043CB